MDVASQQAAHLPTVQCSSAQSYVLEFSEGVNRALRAERESGRIGEYPAFEEDKIGRRFLICKLLFAGYFRGEPFQCAGSLFHEAQKLREPEVKPEYPNPGEFLTLGAQEIHDLMYEQCDPRFASYVKPYHPALSLQGAAMLAEGYIQACCDPLASEIQPRCRAIGGHIHIADITPTEFRWRVPPIATSTHL